jgi:hypothetical protein
VADLRRRTERLYYFPYFEKKKEAYEIGNENAAFTVGWKKFAETGKGAAAQVEHESHVDGFFTSRVLCVRGKQRIACIILMF